MDYMKVTLHSDAIERFEKIFDRLIDERWPHPFQDLTNGGEEFYRDFLTAIQDLDIIHLSIDTKYMEFSFYYPYDIDKNTLAQYEHKYARFNNKHIYIPHELFDKIIYDSRIGIGFCILCGNEYPIEQGCIQETNRLGRCHPKNFIPCLDKDGNKVFKGFDFYKHHSEFNSDEFLPHSLEVIEERRRHAKIMGEASRLAYNERVNEIEKRRKETGLILESDLPFVRNFLLLDKLDKLKHDDIKNSNL